MQNKIFNWLSMAVIIAIFSAPWLGLILSPALFVVLLRPVLQTDNRLVLLEFLFLSAIWLMSSVAMLFVDYWVWLHWTVTLSVCSKIIHLISCNTRAPVPGAVISDI